jgi:hypothetical protein
MAMSISKHVKSLQQHLEKYGLYLVPGENVNEDTANFRIHFLNFHELQRWKEQHQNTTDTEEIRNQSLPFS